MTPWWLRPTAESDKKKDRDKDDTKEGRGAGAPDGTDEEVRDARGSADQSGGEPGTGTKAKGDDRGSAKRDRRRSSRSRRSEEPKEEDRKRSSSRGSSSKTKDDGKKQDDAPKKERRSAQGKERKDSRSGRSSKPSKSGKGSGKDSSSKQDKQSGGGGGGGGRAPAPHDITAEDIESIHRELFDAPGAGMDSDLDSVPERTLSVNDERKIAMFCDLENIALGVRDSDIKKFDINLVLERLLEKGKIIVKRAYCDWERYSEYKRAFHEAAIEMLDIPQKYYSGKNSADIKMVVDAMDLCYAKEHLDTFALLSGDSDFSPLVSKLKENDKYVIGIGVKNSSSALLVDNCDEFIYYEDVWRDRQAAPELAGLNKKAAEAFGLMIDAIQALIRENKEVLWGSMIKQTMQRKRPSFNEGYYGYSSFSDLLEDAQAKNILRLKKDKRSGTYIVTGFAKR